LRPARDGAADGAGGLRARLPRHHGQPRHRREPHAVRQSRGRPLVRPDRPTHPRGPPRSRVNAFWRALSKNRLALAGSPVVLMLVFPRFFLLLAVLAFLTPSIWTIMSVIGLTGWMGVARLVRAEFLALKEREFVIWSQSVGASAVRIIWRHILPNAMAPVLVAMTLGIPAAILTESGLSFLGL